MKLIYTLAVAGAMVGAAQGDVVYDNLSTPTGDYLGGFPYLEAADDVTLAPGSRLFQSLTVAYAGLNFDGDETLTVSIYAMDGAPTAGSFGFNTPGSLLFTATSPITATDGATISFADNSGIILPDTVAVGLSFGGVDFDPAGSDAGPLLYDPPTVGTSFEDYWLRGFPDPSDDWALFTFAGDPPINFGIQIQTGVIPEPGTWMSMFGIAAIIGTVVSRKLRQARA